MFFEPSSEPSPPPPPPQVLVPKAELRELVQALKQLRAQGHSDHAKVVSTQHALGRFVALALEEAPHSSALKEMAASLRSEEILR